MLKNSLLAEVLDQKDLENTSHMWDSRGRRIVVKFLPNTIEDVYKELDSLSTGPSPQISHHVWGINIPKWWAFQEWHRVKISKRTWLWLCCWETGQAAVWHSGHHSVEARWSLVRLAVDECGPCGTPLIWQRRFDHATLKCLVTLSINVYMNNELWPWNYNNLFMQRVG